MLGSSASGWREAVDGFRLDVFNVFFKHPPTEQSAPSRLALAPRGLARLGPTGARSTTRISRRCLALLAEFRSILDAAREESVGSLSRATPVRAASYAAPRHLIFDFRLLEQPWAAARLARAITDAEAAFGPDRWPAVVLSNHDQPRQATRLSAWPVGRSRCHRPSRRGPPC